MTGETFRTQVEDSDCETEGDLQVCQLSQASPCESLEPSSFTHLALRAEVAGASNDAVLAADVDRNSLTRRQRFD